MRKALLGFWQLLVLVVQASPWLLGRLVRRHW